HSLGFRHGFRKNYKNPFGKRHKRCRFGNDPYVFVFLFICKNLLFAGERHFRSAKRNLISFVYFAVFLFNDQCNSFCGEKAI
ncbi:hypothetical protein, partial [Weizmannia acidilactici]|uniref:hypothetical protein n=1 Tax=Weizmannia acidilactici TaxID=2607726 RepID=UPI001C12B82A